MSLSKNKKQEILKAITFGQRVAEDESNELTGYFLETNQWRQIYSGEKDIVYGAKGTGKSAIYSLLLKRRDTLFAEKRIALISAENPTETPAFNTLVNEPPTPPDEFRGLWKLYFLSLVADYFRKNKVSNPETKKVISYLESAKLLPKEFSLGSLLKSILIYVRGFTNASTIEAGIQIDQTGGVNVTGKITLREPTLAEQENGLLSIDNLLSIANKALVKENLKVWILLDRLDVAFEEDEILEKNALRALFRVYRDIKSYSNFSLKIFLRTDIWNRIAEGGMREASHAALSTTITWDEQTLLNLIVLRLVHNDTIADWLKIEPKDILQDADKQKELFYRLFPDKVDLGDRKLHTLNWILARVADATRKAAPREVIHLLSEAQMIQIHKFEIGIIESHDSILIERASLKEALPEVSRARFEQTLCAEFPALQPWLLKLRNRKTQQRMSTLSKIWGCNFEETRKIADKLVEVGFFEKKGLNDAPQFWVPFLYRSALNMSQGSEPE